MKLQKTTLILLALALSLGGFVYFYEIQGKEQRETLQQKNKLIFQVKEDEIINITIKKDDQILEFEQTNQPTHKWQMKQPENTPASDASVAFLTNLLAKGESSQSFTITEQEKADYGLKVPVAEITFKLKNQQTYQLILGKPSFNGESIYVQKPEALTVFLVPINFQYAVERDLSEWKKQDN